MKPLERYITRAQVARALGLSEATVSTLLDAGKLPSVQAGRSSWRRVWAEDVVRFAEQHGYRLDIDALLE